MKKCFKLLVYSSLAFLVYALFSKGYFEDFSVHNWTYFSASIPLLCLGFVGQGLQWWAVLRAFGYKLGVKDSVISIGLSMFAKYIPGKVWLIFGRATFVAGKLGLSLKDVSWLSLVSQTFGLWVGLLLGLLLAPIFGDDNPYLILLVVGIFLLSLFLFHRGLMTLAENLILKILKRQMRLPFVPMKQALMLLPYFLFTWLSWSVGFYFLAFSVTGLALDYGIILAFPLAASLGIMALLVPGGLGVRESILVGVMVLLSIDTDSAIRISIMQRIWFLIGESFIFVLALALNNWKTSFHNHEKQ